jgi:hypothetical protein
MPTLLPPRPRLREHPEDVAPDDLHRLDAIHALLATLNDPLASQPQIERLCAAMPVLSARLIAYGRAAWPKRKIERLADSLRLVGNRGVEVVLLQLLEDLTVLKADLDDDQEAAAAGRPPIARPRPR